MLSWGKPARRVRVRVNYEHNPNPQETHSPCKLAKGVQREDRLRAGKQEVRARRNRPIIDQ